MEMYIIALACAMALLIVLFEAVRGIHVVNRKTVGIMYSGNDWAMDVLIKFYSTNAT